MNFNPPQRKRTLIEHAIYGAGIFEQSFFTEYIIDKKLNFGDYE